MATTFREGVKPKLVIFLKILPAWDAKQWAVSLRSFDSFLKTRSHCIVSLKGKNGQTT